MAILIKNASCVIRDINRIEKGVDILIKGNRISKVGKYEQSCLIENENVEIIDASGRAVIPGLINAHTHLYQNLLKGREDNLSLVEWCEEVTFPLCELITKEQLEKKDETLGYYWSLLASLEMLKNGTTACINMDMMSDSIFQGWKDTGIRGIGAITCADMWIPESIKKSTEKVMEDTLGFIERWHSSPSSESHIYTMFGPSTPFVCSEKLLLWIREQATERNMKIHIHVSETQYEVELIQKEQKCRPVEYLEHIGFLGSDVSAPHCIHLNDRELEIIKKYGVVPVHNPKSNMKLASGIAPVCKMLSLGINVALANDGSASNDNLDMFEEMRAASLLQKVAFGNASVISGRDVFRMATEGGALACGIDAGTIDEGKLADLVLINLNKPHLLPMGDPINTIVYCARGSDVETVLVNGRVTVRNGEVVTLPEKEVIEEAKSYVEKKLEDL